MTGGYPLGALARARTLFELAVTGFVIGHFGRQPATSDLATRYLADEVIARSHFAKQYQEAATLLGLPGIPQAEIDVVESRRDMAINRYGSEFEEANGWAAVLTESGKAARFEHLEKLAQMSHLRTEYQWMCWEVHAGSIALSLNVVERGADILTLPGPTNMGLGRPGLRALASLAQITCAFFVDGNPYGEVRSTDLVALTTLQKLIDRFDPLAEAAEQRVMLRETKPQHQVPDSQVEI